MTVDATTRRLPGALCSAWVVGAMLLATVGTSSAEGVRVARADARLWVSFEVDNVLNDAVWSSLRSGLPTRVRQRIALWQRRSALWDRRVEELSTEYRVVYDLIEETYDLFDTEGLLESNLDPPEIEERVATMLATSLMELNRLSAEGSYYVEVEVLVQPLSVEEVRDLERWLNGRIRGEGGLGRLSSQVIGLFKSQVGLGERRRNIRSPDFRRASLEELGEPRGR
jgi:Domain of unknown function (DUF4390)